MIHPTAHSPRRGDPGGAARRPQSGAPTVRPVHGGVQYREYLREEQRSQPRERAFPSALGWERGCIAGRTGSPARQPRWGPRMQPEFHHGLLMDVAPVPACLDLLREARAGARVGIAQGAHRHRKLQFAIVRA